MNGMLLLGVFLRLSMLIWTLFAIPWRLQGCLWVPWASLWASFGNKNQPKGMMNIGLCRPGCPRASREAKWSPGTPKKSSKYMKKPCEATFLRPLGTDDSCSFSNSNKYKQGNSWNTSHVHFLLAMDVVSCSWHKDIVCHQMKWCLVSSKCEVQPLES